MVIQLAPPVAVQGQLDSVWTDTLAVPPEAATDTAAGAIENVQGAACSEMAKF